MAFYLVAILQAGSIAGRILAAFIADKIGAMNLASIVCAGASILAFCCMGIENEPGLIIWAVLLGCSLVRIWVCNHLLLYLS